MRGMSLLGFVRTRSCVDVGLSPTPEDILFFTKHFGEGVIGICSSTRDIVLYNITKEGYSWGKNANGDLHKFPHDHCVEAKWIKDETSSLFFLVTYKISTSYLSIIVGTTHHLELQSTRG